MSSNALLTPQWREWMHDLPTSAHPRMRDWWVGMQYPSSFPPENGYGVWDWLYAVATEKSDPATSEAKYAEAIAANDPWLLSPPNGNYTHTSQWYAWMIDVLQGRVPEETKAAWVQAQKARCDNAQGWGQWGPTTRIGDSDVVVGAWGMLRTTDKLLGILPGNDKLYRERVSRDNGGEESIGCSCADMEQAIKELCELNPGGEWIEGMAYNLGTVRELAFTASILDTDCPSWLRAWLAQSAEQHLWHWAKDFGPDAYQFWGDHEGTRHRVGYYRGPLYHALSRFAATLEIRANLLALSRKVYPSLDGASWVSSIHSFVLVDPRELPESTEVDWPEGTKHAEVGLTIHRVGDDFVQNFCPVPVWRNESGPGLYVDHQMDEWTLRWRRGGVWLIDHPNAYMPFPRTVTGSLCYGFSPPFGARIVDRIEHPDGFEVVMETSQPEVLPGWDPAPRWIFKWTRGVRFYQFGYCEIHERIEAHDPTQQYNFNRIPNGQAAYDSRLAPLCQVAAHTLPGVEVTETADGFEWDAPNGIRMRVQSTAPLREATVGVKDVNLGTYITDEQTGGRILQLGHDYEIRTRIGLASVIAELPAIQPIGEPPVLPPLATGPVVPPPPSPPSPPKQEEGVIVINNGDEGAFTLEGDWIHWTAGGYMGDMDYAEASSEIVRKAHWFKTLPPGRYHVATTWVPYPNRATNAKYTVTKNGELVYEVLVNQELAPESFSDTNQQSWHTLIEVVELDEESELRVTLDNSGDEYAMADAVRIELVSDVPTDPSTNPLPVFPLLYGKDGDEVRVYEDRVEIINQKVFPRK